MLSSIAYTASFWPKTPKPVPKLLEGNRDWKKLVKGVREHVEAALDKKGKGKGKGAVKPFTLRIFDTSGGDTKAAGGGNAKKVADSITFVRDLTYIKF